MTKAKVNKYKSKLNPKLVSAALFAVVFGFFKVVYLGLSDAVLLGEVK